MYLVKGKTRIVIVLVEWGIVIKLARIRLWPVLRHIKRILRHPSDTLEYIRIERRTKWWYWSSSIKQPLLAGLMENWCEFRFYRKTRLKILQPTFFSVGLFNIQKYAEPLDPNTEGFWVQLIRIVSWSRIGFDHHHFSNPANFAIVENKLVALDYGNPRTTKILFRCGDKIHDQFDPNKIIPAR